MPPSKNKQKLKALCEKLCQNDPSATVVHLDEYGKIEWEDASELAAALEKSTHVRHLSLCLKKDWLCFESTLPISYFLTTSRSLRILTLWGDGSTKNNESSTSILEAIAHNQNITRLELDGINYKRPILLEKVLAMSPALAELVVVDYGSRNTLEVARSLRRGFQQDKSLEKVNLIWKGSCHLDDIIFGLADLPKLKNLMLDSEMNGESSQALRALVKYSKTLDYLSLTIKSSRDKSPSLAPILLGLAANRSIKTIELEFPFTPHEPACLSAWTEMLEKNETMTVLRIMETDNDGRIDRECTTAITTGLCQNISLCELDLGSILGKGAFHGPSWASMLERNHSLKELKLGDCFMDSSETDSFTAFAQGLSRNSCLKALNVSRNCIGNTGASALGNAVQNNVTLEDLDLSDNGIDSLESATVIRALWTSKTLKRLSLSENEFGRNDDGTVFPQGLPKNNSFERLDLDGCALTSDGFVAILESLQDNTVLKKLNLDWNSIVLDLPCATALQQVLESSLLHTLNFCGNEVTIEGITILTDSLKNNENLKDLSLFSCHVGKEELLKLGEALVENKTLEIIDLRRNAFDADTVSQFFELLPKMKGLKQVMFDGSDINDTNVGSAIVKGLRVNTSLETIYGISESQLSSHLKRSIIHHMRMNRNGRKFLREPLTNRMPMGAWPHILAKISPPLHRDQLFYFLRHKANLVKSETTRKRKAQDNPAALSLSQSS